MACGLQFSIRDVNGVRWVATIDSQGRLVATLTPGNVPDLVLQDYFGGSGKSFLVSLNANGMLTTTPAAAGSGAKWATASDDAGNSWQLICDSGGMLFTKLSEAAPPVVVVGLCLGNDQGYPAVQQPGGVGTQPTAPVQGHGGGSLVDQKPNESTGQYWLGCGHNVQRLEIRFQAVACLSSALCLCSLCGWVQRIVTPASEIYNNVSNPIILP